MIKGILIFIFSLLNVFTTFGQDSLVVKVCTTDCMNCYGNMYSVEKFIDSLPVTLVFPNISEREIKYYTDNLLHIQDVSKYNIVVSDSIYREIQQSVSSEVLVYNTNKQLKNRYELEKFRHNDLGSDDIVTPLPDSIMLSAHVEIDYRNNIFQIVDYRFGQIILLDKNTNKLRIIKAKDLTSPLVFEIVCKNKTSYQSFKRIGKQLKYVNYDKVRFLPLTGALNSMASLVEVPDISFVNDSNVSVNPRYGIIEFTDLNNFSLYGIDEKSIPKGYYIDTHSFLHDKEMYYLALTRGNKVDTIGKDNYFIGRFKKVKNQLVYQNFIDWKLPKVYQRENMKTLAVVPILTNSYFFIQYSPEVFDLKQNVKKTLPLDSNVVDIKIDEKYRLISNNYSYQISDSKFDEANIYVLYFNKTDGHHLLIVNRKTFQSTGNIQIGRIKNTRSSVQLLDSHHLYYVLKDNSIVVKKLDY